MPDTKTEFYNFALGIAGQKRIQSVNEASPEAQWCNTFWEIGKLRQALLRTSRWKFADARAQLAVQGDQPTIEFSIAYGLPAKFIMLREYNGDAPQLNPNDPLSWIAWPGKYKIEGNRLFSNDSTVLIAYTQDVEDPGLWEPMFYQMAANVLGSHLRRSVGKDPKVAMELLQLGTEYWLPMASAVDGQQVSPQAYVADDLIWGR